MRILVVEDDKDVSRQIRDALTAMRYVVDLAYDGIDGQFLGETESYDAVVLDLGLPGREGLDILQAWRKKKREMPVLILTARDTWREKVVGLRAGADDYLAKPFEMEEMLARLEALIRRASGHADSIMQYGDIVLDAGMRRVTVAGQPLELTAQEYMALDYFMHKPGRVISKTELVEHIYEGGYGRDSNVIEVLIARLRKKIGTDMIRTHRGQGYQFIKPDESF
ncbi:MAG: response regulator transcription factor [Gammaproteobacteria bacterium]|nr:response regulator transcription factor [Gammaproteobacteria bacterium]